MEDGHDLNMEPSARGIAMAKHMVEVVTSEGNTKEDLIKHYKAWSQDNSYEKDTSYQYLAPVLCAASASQYLNGQPEAFILDVGAGTGLVGLELSERGFTNVEALDPSEDMLNIAAKKKVYKRIHVSFFTDDMAFIKTNTYDAITSSAALGAGHIEHQALREFVRIVKPGGYVFISTGIALLTKELEIINQMRSLEEEGLWRQLEKRVVNNYWIDEDGLMFVFEIIKQ